MQDSIKGTVENLMLKDYCDENVFKSFQELNEAPFIKNFKYYTLFELYKNCQGKIILDIPSSYGYIALKFLELGAEHVICSDIVSEQLEYGKSIFNGKGYDSSKCSFIQHDGKIPKVIGPFADLVISFHLFCFADNEEEIENMAEMLFLNLKPKGEAVISFCPIL
jgi:SAM-dependent methyltransferase